LYLGLNGWLAAWWIDPSRDRLCRRFGLLSDEAFGVSAEGAVKGDLASGVDFIGLTVVHLVYTENLIRVDAVMESSKLAK
jgi:hypothetical protein